MNSISDNSGRTNPLLLILFFTLVAGLILFAANVLDSDYITVGRLIYVLGGIILFYSLFRRQRQDEPKPPQTLLDTKESANQDVDNMRDRIRSRKSERKYRP
jgi:hypothetical protein